MLHPDEQRNYKRMTIDAKVVITLPESPRTLEASCIELSGSGMAIELGRSFPLKQYFDVELQPNGDRIPSLKATAEVVRCEPTDNHQYRLGLLLTNIH